MVHPKLVPSSPVLLRECARSSSEPRRARPMATRSFTVPVTRGVQDMFMELNQTEQTLPALHLLTLAGGRVSQAQL